MKISDIGKQLLKSWEGMELKVYLDSGSAPTLGIGHLITKSEKASGKIIIGTEVVIYYRNGLTVDQCWRLLDQDLEPAEKAVNDARMVELSQNQYDTLVIFTFNIGVTAFEESRLLKLLNQGHYDQVPAQLRRWIHDNGRVVQGLINRREKEIKLWNGEF